MKAPAAWARVFYLLAALGFLISGFLEHGLIVPLAGAAVALVLIFIAQQNARKRKAEGGSQST